MINLEKQQDDNKQYAIVTALFEGARYTSMPLELTPNSENIKLVMTLSETGTSMSSMIKLPVAANKFIVFSKEQLYGTLFEIEILEELPAEPKKSKKAKQINS
jgi:hypothetical protein